MCNEFVKLWVDQKELTDLHSKIPTMYRHKINRTTAEICIGRGRILVNCETRFAKLTVMKQDGCRVTIDVHRKVLLERNMSFMKKMSCIREKEVSHMVDISECDDVEIYVETVVLIYCDDLKRKLVCENIIKILALLQVSAAMSFDEGMMSCLEHLEAAPWSEDEEDIVLSCLDERHLPKNSLTVILQRVSSEPTRARTDDIFLKLLTGVVQAKDDKPRREMKVLIFKLLREEDDHEVSKYTLYVLCHKCLVSLVLYLSEATTQIIDSGKDHGALMGEIAREDDNMLWMVDKLIRKKYNKDIRKDHKALGKVRRECERAKRAFSNQHQVRAKEKLAVVETELGAARLDSKECKEKHEEVRKESDLLKNTSERLRIEEEESLLAWNGKESVIILKRGRDEKSSLLDENNRLLVALIAAENLRKKAKDENMAVRDILKPVINKANMAKEAVTGAENSNLTDALLDKEEELQFALKEVER
ncbi:hypothetical protein N665_0297s0010 [Sinapis alba]|nr:hypothetical protein N665_0297s0010 [Sinapis alba]